MKFASATAVRPRLVTPPILVVMASEKTLDKFVGNNCGLYKVTLKSCYFDVKTIRNFCKGTGRLKDRDGNTIWYEVTGANQSEVKQRATKMLAGKAGIYSNLKIKTTHWYVGGRLLDANPSSGMRCSPMAQSHPDF